MNKLSSVIISFILIITVMFPAIARETKRRDSKTRTVAKIGVGTAFGAGVGALIGGGRGAAAGALIGGGALTAHSLAKRDSGYGRKTRMVSTIAAGSLVGTGLGAAIGGKKGALIGALIGGGSSTLYALTRNDLKAPSRSPQTRPTNFANRELPAQNIYSNNATVNNPNLIRNVNFSNDPYQRLSGPQGAMVGSLLANGSNSLVQLSNPY